MFVNIFSDDEEKQTSADFPVFPQVGHVIKLDSGMFIVKNVGFVKSDIGMQAAIWTESLDWNFSYTAL